MAAKDKKKSPKDEGGDKGGKPTHLPKFEGSALDDPINRRIWDLRIRARRTLMEIADDVGIHYSSVRERLKKIFAEIPVLDPAEVEARKIDQLESLDENEAALWATFLRKAAEDDDLAMARLTNAMTRIRGQRNEMLGMNAPRRIEIDGVVREPLAAELEIIAEAVGELEAGDDEDAA